MTTFTDALVRFNVTAQERVRDVFVDSTVEVQRSVVTGSELTGAPGQPVITGNLKTSWIGEFTSDATWELTTKSEYAIPIENGENDRGPFNPQRGAPRSEVGGYHSVKLTRAGWPRIVESVVARVAGAGRG